MLQFKQQQKKNIASVINLPRLVSLLCYLYYVILYKLLKHLKIHLLSYKKGITIEYTCIDTIGIK